MPKRKYTRMGETPVAYQCTNKKCKWEGLDSEKVLSKPIDDYGMRIHLCPECDNDEFYGLLELPDCSKSVK